MDKVMKYFINEPEKEFYVRELAKKEKISPTTVSKHLKELKNKKILKSEKKFNHLLYKANTENKNYKLIKLQSNLEKVEKSGVIDFLNEEFNYPSAIILFGSYCKSENTSKSDLDLAVITESKKEVNLDNFEKKIGNPIQVFKKSSKEIENMKKSNPHLLNSFINGITVRGFLEVFE